MKLVLVQKENAESFLGQNNIKWLCNYMKKNGQKDEGKDSSWVSAQQHRHLTAKKKKKMFQ